MNKKNIFFALLLIVVLFFIQFNITGWVTRIISSSSDTNELYIRNSHGFHWEPTGANIQLAIDNTSDLGGGTVSLPAGTLVPTSTIYLRDNVRLIGRGIGVTIIKAENNYGGTIIRTSSGSRQYNITVSDLTIDGNYVMGNPLYLHSASNVIVERVHARRSTSNGFGVFGNCEKVFMTKCIASELQGDSYEGFAINSAWDSVFSNLIAYDIDYMGMDFHTLHNCVLSNLIVRDSGMGIKFFGDPGEKGGNNVVTNVNIENGGITGSFGLWIKREYNSSFTNINVRGDRGIVLDGSNDINLNNFYVESSENPGLHISSHIHGCERLNIANGIVINRGSTGAFYANSIKDSVFSNIQFFNASNYNNLANAENVVIKDCSFVNGNERGLIVRNSDRVIVSDSEFKNNNGAGIWIYGSDGPCNDFIISDNLITENNAGIKVDAFAHDNYVITNNVLTGNSGQALDDGGTGSNKIVGENLA